VWTGFVAEHGNGTPTAQQPAAKSLWDWLQLLIVPFVLALAAFALNAAQDRRESTRDEERASRERAAAAERAREDSLRGYFQQMSDLITEHRLGSHGPRSLTSRSPDVAGLARTLTLTVLRRLDGDRKGLVLQFLAEAKLIVPGRRWRSSTSTRRPKASFRYPVSAPCVLPRHQRCWQPPVEPVTTMVSLRSADLRGAVLRGRGLNFFFESFGTYVRVFSADLSGTDLRNADFQDAGLRGVSFDHADLRGADFSGATLSAATFHGACLTEAKFGNASLYSDVFSGFPSTAYLGKSEGRDVDFSHSRLDRVDFRQAALTDVDLSGASTAGTMFPSEDSTRASHAAKPGRQSVSRHSIGSALSDPSLVRWGGIVSSDVRRQGSSGVTLQVDSRPR
jgi:uncharacterized protein YjbI with pentapeptide repeats